MKQAASGMTPVIVVVLVLVSLLVVSAGAVTMEKHLNMNIQGGDYYHWDFAVGTQWAAFQGSCVDRCLSESRCTAATFQYPGFTGRPNSDCWLKEGTMTASMLQPQHDTIIWLKVQDTPTTGRLSLQSTPAGARIFLNGADTGFTTPHDFLNQPAGGYAVRLTLAGYKDYQIGVAVNAGQTAAIGTILEANAPAVPTTGSLSITSTPSNAAVIFDGVSRGTTPTTLVGEDVGSHTVRVTREGYEDYEGTVIVTAGQNTPLTVMLSAVVTTVKTTLTRSSGTGVSAGTTTSSGTGPSAGTGTGSIEVRSQPSGATITLDGSQKGVTPARLSNVRTGTHEVMVSLAGYPDYKQTVTVETGSTTKVTAAFGSTTDVTAPSGSPMETGTTTQPAVSYTSPPVTETFPINQQIPGIALIRQLPGFTAVLGILAIAGIFAGRRIIRP